MKTIRINIPEQWNALTTHQLCGVGHILSLALPPQATISRLFVLLAGCRWYTFLKNYRVYTVLKNVPVSELQTYLAFIFLDCYRTIFPEINGRKPYEALGNLTAAEFAAAEDLHAMYLENNRPIEALHYLASVLYPEPGETFNRYALDERHKRFATVPPALLYAMELAYRGSKNRIVRLFPQAFKPAEDGAKGKKYGFGKVISVMAGGKFGPLADTEKTNIYALLEEFNDNLKKK